MKKIKIMPAAMLMIIFSLFLAQNCGDAAKQLVDNLTATCGNNSIEGSEECDDGNTNNFDGCSMQCVQEIIYCGNNALDQGWEQCDDGNQTNGDGCSSSCQNEAGPGQSANLYEGIITSGYLYGGSFVINYTFVPATTVKAAVTYDLYFMDASGNDGTVSNLADILVSATGSVTGNFFSNVNAGFQTPWSFSNQTAGETITITVTSANNSSGNFMIFMAEQSPNCGNNVVDAGETCDDGNTNNGDGCDQFCQMEIASPVGVWSGTYNTVTGANCEWGWTDNSVNPPVSYYRSTAVTIDANGFVTNNESMWTDSACTQLWASVEHIGNYQMGFIVGPYATVANRADAYVYDPVLMMDILKNPITVNSTWTMSGREVNVNFTSLSVQYQSGAITNLLNDPNGDGNNADKVCGLDWFAGSRQYITTQICHNEVETVLGGGLGPWPGFTMYTIMTFDATGNIMYIGHEDNQGNNGMSAATRHVLWNGYGGSHRIP